MKNDISNDSIFIAIKEDVELSGGLLNDAWVQYKGQKWHPVISKDRKTGQRGFEVNFSGEWGKNADVGRKKIDIVEFMQGLANSSFPSNAAVRCKRPGDPQRNGRHMANLQFSPRLRGFLERIHGVRVPVPHSSGSNGLGVDVVPSISNETQRTLGVTPDSQVTLALDTKNLETGEREAVVKVRFGQGDFRDALLKIDGDKCWMSGIEGKRLLIASHIKPWSHCETDTDARGRPDNGLLLSALWDAAFDAGLISFDSNWTVVASAELSGSAKKNLGLDQGLTLPEKFRTNERKGYLTYHRADVFEYWKKRDML